MSKIVVGMNSSPAIMPHMIDCGFRNTVPRPRMAWPSQSLRCAVASRFGNSTNSMTAISSPVMPMPIQKLFHASPDWIAGPTMNCPAEPPAMPNICVAPISVAARDAGKFVVAM